MGRKALLAASATLALVGACAEPPPERVTVRATSSTTSTESSGPEPAAGVLRWTAPAIFLPQAEESKRSLRGWRYRVEPSGADKEPAELVVSSAPAGKAGEIEENLRVWVGDFDADAAPTVRRSLLELGTIKVHRVEAAGTFKVGMGPPVGRTGRHAVAVVKRDWRMLAAAVQTLDRGRWFFHLAGPNDTVESVRSAFEGLLRSIE
ncbi:MAG: hypothetical protein IT373_02045 [Polyangiaceae bacterium]|nr:hypothetical protein [Polyangiaceae bacterium]